MVPVDIYKIKAHSVLISIHSFSIPTGNAGSIVVPISNKFTMHRFNGRVSCGKCYGSYGNESYHLGKIMENPTGHLR